MVTTVTTYPEEMYVAFLTPSPGIFGGYTITLNPRFVEEKVLSANSTLRDRFHIKIRKRFEELAPDLQRGRVSDIDLDEFKAEKKSFHEDYQKWKQTFFAEQQAVAQVFTGNEKKEKEEDTGSMTFTA